MSTEDEDTPDPDRPGVARSPQPDYMERIVMAQKRSKSGEYRNPEKAAKALSALERAGRYKTWGLIASVALGGGAGGHGFWRSNEEAVEHARSALQAQHEHEARVELEKEVDDLRTKVESVQLEVAVCCDRRK